MWISIEAVLCFDYLLTTNDDLLVEVYIVYFRGDAELLGYSK